MTTDDQIPPATDDEWIAERQAELDALLRDRPDLYLEARIRFQKEYDEKFGSGEALHLRASTHIE